MKKIRGKTFIITGASKGIGKVMTRVFLEAGASVVITGRNLERLDKTKNELEENGFFPLAVQADLTKPDDCRILVQEAVDHFGKVDGLINNAGLPLRGRFEDISMETFAEVIAGNLLSSVNCTGAALSELIKNRGSVVFISSAAAIHGLPNAAPYSAGKIGLEKFAESLRIETRQHGMHVGILRPGLVDPPEDKTVLRADGTYRPVTSKGHQSLESVVCVAKATLKMVKRRKGKLTMTPLGKLNSVMHWLAPWFVRMVLTMRQYDKKFEG